MVHRCSNYAEATATRLKCHSERKRGNPLNRNANLNGVLPKASLVLAITNRAENLCYQFEQGQKLLPQFRKIVCLVKCAVGASR